MNRCRRDLDSLLSNSSSESAPDVAEVTMHAALQTPEFRESTRTSIAPGSSLSPTSIGRSVDSRGRSRRTLRYSPYVLKRSSYNAETLQENGEVPLPSLAAVTADEPVLRPEEPASSVSDSNDVTTLGKLHPESSDSFPGLQMDSECMEEPDLGAQSPSNVLSPLVKHAVTSCDFPATPLLSRKRNQPSAESISACVTPVAQRRSADASVSLRCPGAPRKASHASDSRHVMTSRLILASQRMQQMLLTVPV
ncbi:hypothetical protein CLOM_g5656 [Closterium sp. NIES-68]|nr:hypothetical protein CLOM_g5656 [Closterium sp. NIES-68]GJP64009.1 hypothetical protein CLOP_g21045 [Closterium sp. NIES-67]